MKNGRNYSLPAATLLGLSASVVIGNGLRLGGFSLRSATEAIKAIPLA
jgi:hypothetical protein